ncbi:MAG TPA: hypothetical protein VM890_08225 [Longimicrobium sp.]|nr:hypothetical protein [Longimicrobium sp.]
MPATDPSVLLKYRIQPRKVSVGTLTSLVLEIRNDTLSPVTFQPGKDGVVATFPAGGGPDDLSAVVDYAATSITEGFTVARVEGTDGYRVRVAGFKPRALAAGAAVLVRFDGVRVNAVPGADVRVRVEETLGERKARGEATLAKVARALAVVAWVDDLVVGLGQKTTLHWQSSGGTLVVVSGFEGGGMGPDCPESERGTGNQCFPVRGDPPHPGSMPLGVPERLEQRTYTVQVRTGDGQHEEMSVTVTQHRAEITGFGHAPEMAGPTQPIGAMEEVPLQWTTRFGRRAELRTPTNSAGTQVPLNPAAPRPVTPGKDAFLSALDRERIPACVEYVLRVAGFGATAEATLRYELGPVRARFFKFGKRVGDTLSDPVWEVDPQRWPAVEVVMSRPPFTLTVHGPGGKKEVRYLGAGDAVHPQVQYFAAEGTGAAKTLRWVTANLTALRLEPVGYAVPAAQVANGTYEVTPARTTEYVLHATAASGETVTSTLKVVVP